MDQSGRSMVEIIATLSIIGVLSIGGIAGYSYGMNKYRANMTVNDVNLRAVDLLAQLSQGHTPNLDTWETTSTAKYPISLNSDEAPAQYYITVKNVPHEICQLIAEMMPEDVEILVDNDTQECKEGYNTLDFAYNGFTSSTDIPPENEETNNCGTANCTECQTCDTTTQTCINKPSNESKCTISGTSGWCVDGVCQPDTCNCDTGQYCKDAIESCKYPSPSTTCMTPSYTSHTITFTDEDGITRTETWRALSNVNYWEAQDACAAMGGEMPNDPSVFALNWNGGTGAYSKNKRKEALVADGLTGSMWTRKTLDDSCRAYYVLGSSITTYYRNLRYSAVCKMPTTEP